MKIRIMLVMFCVVAMAPAIFAQTTIKLFDAVAVNVSPGGEFGTAQVYMSCPAGATARLTGKSGGGLLVDNYLLVNGANVCPNGGNCFSSVIGDPLQSLGQIVESSYMPIAPIDITNRLKVGTQLYTFSMVDGTYAYGSTEVNLTTSCELFSGTTEDYAVCHQNNGSKQQKTLTVGSIDALNAHLQHHSGDYAGACETRR